MKQFSILWILLLASFISLAQETDTLQTETEVKEGFWYDITSLYVGVGVEAAPTTDGTEPSVQLQLGAEYKKFHVGFTMLDYVGEYQQRLIFPNQFDMLYRHGGVYIGRDIWRTNLIHINALLQWSHGDVVWQRNSTGEDVFRDKMTIWQPTLQLELNPELLIAGYVNVGYRQVNGLELPRITSDDFSGLVIQFGVRLGLFRKTKTVSSEDEEGN
ncbi:MAG: hypothetical protein R8G66_12750 [Cytophagales bacterium]|nr:hypothetical protein [Cytophagales bacterium]